MKNRKLFAILTLVAFMMTLLPIAAFAAANRHATVVTVDKTSLKADGTATAKFTVYTYQTTGSTTSIAPNEWVYIASERGTTDTFTDANGNALTQPLTNVFAIQTGPDGKAEIKVKSTVPGTAKIGIAVGAQSAGTDIYSYLTGASGATSALAGVVKVQELTFTAPSLNAVNVDYISASDGNPVSGTGATEPNAYNSATINGNGVDYYEIAFKVVTSNGTPVADQNVTFSANKTDVRLSKTSATTDPTGVVKVKVYADKPGTYKIKATANDKDKEVYVKFAPNDLYSLELVSGGNETIAKDADYSIKFKLLDINGNQVKVTGFPTSGSGEDAATVASTPVDLSQLKLGLKVEAVTRPSDAAMDEKIYNNSSTSDYAFFTTTEGYLQLKIKGSELDTEGNYEIKVYFDNGKYVTVPFTVKKQGTPVKLSVNYEQESVSLGTTVGAPTVKRIDAEGVSKELSASEVSSDIVFTASDVRKIAASGIGPNGSFTVTSDDKYAGELVITAVDKNKNLAGSDTIIVAKQASGLAIDAPTDVIKVGDDAVVKAKVVDVDGYQVAVGTGVTAVSVDYYVLSKPEGAIVSTSNPSTLLKDIQEKGAADLKISSNKAGEVKVQIVLATTGTPALTVTKDVTLTFGEPKPEVTYGAKNVTLFIGSTGYVADGAAKTMDQAPFIQDNRTFVPVRAIAEALGAEVEFDEATQVITLTRPDLTITLTIGSNVLTKSDGTTVVSDVAPFIVVETGRTVLPFRAIAEAFGAEVEAVFAADGTVTAVTFQQ